MSETMGFDSDKTVVNAPGGDATQVVSTPGYEATQFTANVECPVCHTPNPPSETYCIDCGFMLSSAPVAVEDMPAEASFGRLVSSDGTLEFPLRSGENSVGRESADVLLSNNTVSRKHARVILEAGGLFVEDLGSTNGTYVGGVRLQPGSRAEVKDGVEVVFGSVALKYQAPQAVEAEPEAEVEPVETAESEAPADALEPEAAESITEATQTDEPAEAAEEPLVEAAPVAVAQLVPKAGGPGLDIFDGVNTIGRRQGANTVIVADPYCSGRHADLHAENGTFTLTDVGSSNGTLVNGVRIEPNVPREIQDGDEITLGSPVFKLEVKNG